MPRSGGETLPEDEEVVQFLVANDGVVVKPIAEVNPNMCLSF